jgi:hypothetical protein
MSDFNDEPNINRKGTLHGLVSKSMLANRLKASRREEGFGEVVKPDANMLAVPEQGGRLSVTGLGSVGNRSPGRNSISIDGRDGADEEDELLAKATKSMMAELSREPLPIQYVIENLETRVQATGLYKEFMLFIPFIILFFIFYLNGRNIEENHLSAAGIRVPLLETQFPAPQRNVDTAAAWPVGGGPPQLPQDRQFFTLTRASDYKLWFQDVIIPLIWDCSNPNVRHNPLQQRGQHIALGAMQMRVQIMPNSSCNPNPDYTPVEQATGRKIRCFAEFDSDKSLKTPICGATNPAFPSETLWNYVDAGLISSTGTSGWIASYPGGGYTASIPFNATCAEALAFAETLTDTTFNDPLNACGIISDDTTRFVILEWFQYNPSTDTFLASKVYYEVSSGGSWIPTFQFRAFPVWSTQRLGQTGFDIFFLIFVLYFWYVFATQWLTHYQRTQKILDFLLDTWNIVELVNLTTFLAVLILRFIWWAQSVQKRIQLPFSDGYPAGLDAVVLLYNYQIYANAVNAVITVLKTLKYLRLNNRMNILTRTIDVTKESLAGVLLLFIFVVAAYAISGTALYGSTMWDFRTVDQAFVSLLFMLFGTFDYEAMRQVEPTLTAIYFFSYTILAQFLLLNFIIAILSEGFAQVSTSSAIEPLDQVVLRQLSSLKFTLHPRNLKQWIQLTINGKSRNDLIFEMTKYIQEHMDLIELESPELLDNDLPITIEELKNWLPEHLDNDIGPFYTSVLWDDIAHDYHIDIQSEEYQQKKEIEALIKKGVLSVVTSTVERFEDAETTMRALENIVATLEGYVR